MESERQPLIPPTEDADSGQAEEETPLPKLQLSILLILQLAEPLTSQVIYPFINQVSVSSGSLFWLLRME
jgi:hypothetical protein